MEEEEEAGSSRSTSSGMLVLVDGMDDKLRPWDVICGRCGNAYHNIGNRRFRVTISLNLKTYMASKNRKDKSAVIQSIVDALLEEAGARFLKQNAIGQYEVMNVRHVRQKIQHALRDMAAFTLDEEAEQDYQKNGGKVETRRDMLLRHHQQNLRKDLQRRQQQQQQQPQEIQANKSIMRHRVEQDDAPDNSNDNNNNNIEEADDDASLLQYVPFLEEERMLISRPGAWSPPLTKPPLTMIEEDKLVGHSPPPTIHDSELLTEGEDSGPTLFDDHFFSNTIDDDDIMGMDDSFSFINIHNNIKQKEEICR